MTGRGHEDAFPRPRLSARCRLIKGPSPERPAMTRMRRFRPLVE